MKYHRNQWTYIALAWLVMGVYALILKENTNQNVMPLIHFDKLVHALLFLGQTWLLAKIWLSHQRRPPYWGLFYFGLVYAISSELAQHFFTTTRQGDIWDVLADMVGVLLGLHLVKLRYQIVYRHFK